MTGPGANILRRAGTRRPVLIAIVYGLTVVATTGIIGGTVLVATRDVLLGNEREYLRATTKTAAAVVDGDLLATFTRADEEHSREYAAAVRPLIALDSADNSIVHASTAVVHGDSMRVELDASAPGARTPGGVPEHQNFGTAVAATPEAQLAWAAHKTFVAEKPSATPWGDGLQASAPVFGRDGREVAVVNLTLSLDRYHAEIARLDNTVFAGAAVGLLLAWLAGIAAYRVEISRRAAELQLMDAKLAAEASASAKGEFLANMSHEIRTPLHGVLGMSEAMLGSVHTEADRRSLEVINKSASSLLVILNDILDYSKLEAGRVELMNAPFDPRGLVDDVVDLFAVKAAEQNLEIAVRETLRAERWPEGDASRLKQVLLNLVGNGVKFTSKGSVRVDLETIMIGRKTIAVRVAVRDTGIGIAPETQRRLFEQFEQGEASTSRRFGGTGLGLAISRQLVLLMGGSLTVKSVLGAGSEFIVDLQLPISPVTREASLAPRLPVGARALVSCAHPLTREAIVEMLTRSGVTAEPCTTESAALTRLKSGTRFACVFCDAPPDSEPAPSPFAASGVPLVLITSLHKPLNNSTLSAFGASAQLRRPVREDHLDALLTELSTGRLGTAAGAAASVAPPAPAPAAPQPSTGGPARVLVVDDVELNLMVARAMLGSLGAHVTSANGGATALAELARAKFDLILMDCHMPEIDGYEVTRRVRGSRGLNAKTPIVALSASAFADDRQRALEAGMDDFAPKPIELSGLRTVLTNFIPGFEGPAAPKTESSAA
jgi:signal transduction histidine kinase/CheY-like chemotaxis protein